MNITNKSSIDYLYSLSNKHINNVNVIPTFFNRLRVAYNSFKEVNYSFGSLFNFKIKFVPVIILIILIIVAVYWVLFFLKQNNINKNNKSEEIRSIENMKSQQEEAMIAEQEVDKEEELLNQRVEKARDLALLARNELYNLQFSELTEEKIGYISSVCRHMLLVILQKVKKINDCDFCKLCKFCPTFSKKRLAVAEAVSSLKDFLKKNGVRSSPEKSFENNICKFKRIFVNSISSDVSVSCFDCRMCKKYLFKEDGISCDRCVLFFDGLVLRIEELLKLLDSISSSSIFLTFL